MAQVTVLFANKGGVGKTTTTLHLALAMARAGKRVLVYDCDSQRNLSHSLLAHELKKDNGDWNAMTKRLVPQGQYASLYEQHTAARLYLPVPCTKRKREREDDATVSTASTASTAPDFAAFAHKIDAGREGEGGGELFLVQGHKHTYKMDATIQIAEALKALNYPNYEAARVRSIVAATAARYKCDMVLMDLSPNAASRDSCQPHSYDACRPAYQDDTSQAAGNHSLFVSGPTTRHEAGVGGQDHGQCRGAVQASRTQGVDAQEA